MVGVLCSNNENIPHAASLIGKLSCVSWINICGMQKWESAQQGSYIKMLEMASFVLDSKKNYS